MSQTVGDFFVERLHAWGVRRIFGYPGDGINGVPGALNRAHGKIDFVQVRHEEMAAFMASAYAIAGKFAHPDRPVIALVGDGAMQMNNMAELITVSKYWKQWSNPKLIVCVFNNEDLNQVTWEQRVMEGDPKFNATQQIPNVPYHRFAELIGLTGIFCDQADQVGAAWEEALAADRPVVLEFKTDPEVPPLPSHMTLKEAKNFASTIIAGDPREASMIAGAARQVLSAILPGDKS